MQSDTDETVTFDPDQLKHDEQYKLMVGSVVLESEVVSPPHPVSAMAMVASATELRKVVLNIVFS